jgi:hypothetical protein
MTLRRAVEVSGPRPADDVWDRYFRPARWPEWSPQIRSVEYPAATLQPGTRGTVRGPGGLPVRFRIETVVPDGAVRTWSWVARAAGVEMRLWHTVEAVAPGGSQDEEDEAGTRTVLAIEGPAPVVLLYLPVARLALHRLVR